MADKIEQRRASRAAIRPRLPQGLAPRGLRKEEAAAYAGCETIRAFEAQMQRGILPGAMPGTTQWDRKALDYAMDRLSGLLTTHVNSESAAEEALRTWEAEQAVREERPRPQPDLCGYRERRKDKDKGRPT